VDALAQACSTELFSTRNQILASQTEAEVPAFLWSTLLSEQYLGTSKRAVISPHEFYFLAPSDKLQSQDCSNIFTSAY